MRQTVGILGDVHTLFDSVDVRLLDAQGYDAILFVGDLAGFRPGTDIETAQRMAELKTRTFVHPGNHDGTTPPQLLAEVMGSERLAAWFAVGQEQRVARLREALGQHTLTGYSRHTLIQGALELVAGRPHSFGGHSRLGCAPYLRSAFDIDSLEASAERIRGLIEDVASPDFLVLAHNGPFGLGEQPDSIWGCDFRPEWGDFGDPDLQRALQVQGSARLRAVVAGHMHHRVKGTSKERAWAEARDGVLYVNAARVPRIFRDAGRRLRHHVRLILEPSSSRVEQVVLDEDSGVAETIAERTLELA